MAVLAVTAVSGCSADLAQRGTDALARGDVARAVTLLDRAAARSPNDPDVRAAYARALLRAHRPEEALAQARAAFAASGAPKHRLLRGRAAVAAGDRQAGRADIVRAARDLEGPVALLDAAAALARLDAPDDAARAALRAAAHPKATAATATSAVVILAEVGRRRAAWDLATTALRGAPDHVPLLVAAGALAVRTRRLVEARRIYEHLLEVAPRIDATHQALALVCFELRDLDCARRHARAAVMHRGDRDPAVHYTWVLVLEAHGEHDAARAALRRARARFPGDRALAGLAIPLGLDATGVEDRPAGGVVEQPPSGREAYPGARPHDEARDHERREDAVHEGGRLPEPPGESGAVEPVETP